VTTIKRVKLKQKSEHTGPLFNKDGTVAVDPQVCPTLHARLEASRAKKRERWDRVQKLRREGLDDKADRLSKRLLGVKGKSRGPMTEEKKEYLANWKEEHKDEIKQRKQQASEIRKRTLALLQTGTKDKKVRRK
jgi:uncharacterized Zn finger protein (UPF0148 family)